MDLFLRESITDVLQISKGRPSTDYTTKSKDSSKALQTVTITLITKTVSLRQTQIFSNLCYNCFISECMSVNGTKVKQLEVSDSKLVFVTPEKQVFFMDITKENPLGGTAQLMVGNLHQIDVGDGWIVGSSIGEKAFYRGGITAENWKGTGWDSFGTAYVIYVAVGDGKVIGIKGNDFHVWKRKYGDTYWQNFDTSGDFRQISIGDGKILGVNKNNEVFYRSGVDDADIFGTGWNLLDGVQLKQVDVGYGRIAGVDASGQVWHRWGISPSQPSGKGWRKTRAGFFQHVSCGDGILFCVDEKGNICICQTDDY